LRHLSEFESKTNWRNRSRFSRITSTFLSELWRFYSVLTKMFVFVSFDCKNGKIYGRQEFYFRVIYLVTRLYLFVIKHCRIFQALDETCNLLKECSEKTIIFFSLILRQLSTEITWFYYVKPSGRTNLAKVSSLICFYRSNKRSRTIQYKICVGIAISKQTL